MRIFLVFVILYNTEKDCDNAPECSEERWNIAEWDNSEEFFLADEDECVDGTEVLYQWFVSQGISEIREDESSMYDDDMKYIGKGPTGITTFVVKLQGLSIKYRMKT